VAATITTVLEPEGGDEAVFLVTRRELAVLAVAITVVVAAVLLLIVTSGNVAGELLSSGQGAAAGS
jgi:multisubunit Na+/H+ antiporter MnhC subunit